MVEEYTCEVRLIFDGNPMEAASKKEYIEKVKDSFYKEFGIDLDDKEIKNVRRREQKPRPRKKT